MVKDKNKDITERCISKGDSRGTAEASKISASTHYETCREQLSPFGGLLALIKFLDVIEFEAVFEGSYQKPAREPKLGHYRMVVGIVLLLFIGFNRLWHFSYIRFDSVVSGFFKVVCLPVASTFWRYVDSLGINQSQSVLRVMGVVRERVWQLGGISHKRIHVDVDTTVETLYGEQQGGSKGHNTAHRGKKGYRPLLCFIQETREYLVGKLRSGETVSGKECAAFIALIKRYVPGCVRQIELRADGEFLSWEAVKALLKEGIAFIIGNKVCKPVFAVAGWYRPWKWELTEYNSCMYQPLGWEVACRFVAMRIPKRSGADYEQLPLFEDDWYTYRIFCTSLTGKAHEVIAAYDQRADVENLVGEAKREWLAAIPSAKFKNNYAYFQLVLLAYNLWRYMKILAQGSSTDGTPRRTAPEGLTGIMDNTIRIARLKLLFIAAKVATHANRVTVKYSVHDARTAGLLQVLHFLDKLRSTMRPWVSGSLWPCRFALNTQ
jgi:hypothetical protein